MRKTRLLRRPEHPKNLLLFRRGREGNQEAWIRTQGCYRPHCQKQSQSWLQEVLLMRRSTVLKTTQVHACFQQQRLGKEVVLRH